MGTVSACPPWVDAWAGGSKESQALGKYRLKASGRIVTHYGWRDMGRITRLEFDDGTYVEMDTDQFEKDTEKIDER